MNEVFADAFYFIALFNHHDRHHRNAVEATNSIERRIVTTIWVLMEFADALARTPFRVRAQQFIKQTISEPGATVILEMEPWFTRGLELYGNRLDKDWSLTDCISFEVMKDRGIIDALTGDRHFSQAGFRPLLTPLSG